MSKIITDEQELNTATGELVTEDYALEILGLKSIADFRKFSRSFMKLSKIVKKIENSDNNKSEKGHLHDDRYYTEAEVNNELAKKLNKGTVSTEYDTAKKIEDKIKEAKKTADDKANKNHTHDDRYYTEAEINEKFKNFCPFPVNSLHLSLSNQNPSTTWLGTTWDKIEDRFLLGAGSGKYDAGTMGGNSSVSLGINNMPRHRHKVDSTSASVPSHVHSIKPPDSDSDVGHGKCATGGVEGEGTGIAAFNSGSAGGGSTGSFAPYTDYQGDGQAFNIMPPYIKVHIWKRTS